MGINAHFYGFDDVCALSASGVVRVTVIMLNAALFRQVIPCEGNARAPPRLS